MKWHPIMIRWCLYLRHQSGKAYETLCDSGVLSLPSQRTLHDYTHFVKSGNGFSAAVDDHLLKAMKLASCDDHHKLVIPLLDELHIKENLVFEKHDGSLDLGDINEHLQDFKSWLEKRVARGNLSSFS